MAARSSWKPTNCKVFLSHAGGVDGSNKRFIGQTATRLRQQLGLTASQDDWVWFDQHSRGLFMVDQHVSAANHCQLGVIFFDEPLFCAWEDAEAHETLFSELKALLTRQAVSMISNGTDQGDQFRLIPVAHGLSVENVVRIMSIIKFLDNKFVAVLDKSIWHTMEDTDESVESLIENLLPHARLGLAPHVITKSCGPAEEITAGPSTPAAQRNDRAEGIGSEIRPPSAASSSSSSQQPSSSTQPPSFSWSNLDTHPRLRVLCDETPPAEPTDRDTAVQYLAWVLLHRCNLKIYGGFVRDWVYRGQSANDIDCMCLGEYWGSAELALTQNLPSSIKLESVWPKGRAARALCFKFDTKAIDIDLIDFKRVERGKSYLNPGVDSDVSNLALEPSGLPSLKVEHPGLIDLDTSIQHCLAKQFVYYYSPTATKDTQERLGARYLDRGWALLNRVDCDITRQHSHLCKPDKDRKFDKRYFDIDTRS